VVIVLGKFAIVVTTNAIDGGNGALIGAEEGAFPEFLRGDQGFKGIDAIEFVISCR